MGILEQVTQMKSQGISEKEITIRLRDQGISPKEINDAFNQSKIKSAVSNDPITQDMESSVMEQPPEPPKPQYSREQIKTQERPEEELYIPQPQPEQAPPQIQEFPEQEAYDPGYPQEPLAPPVQEFYPQEGYGDYIEDTNMANTDTMLEISEQVFSEKIKKFQKQLANLNEFQALAEIKLENTSTRLKRIETSFDQLQIAILQKIGTYGKNLATTQKEMNMMQDSFRKMVKPLASRTKPKRKPIKRKTYRKK